MSIWQLVLILFGIVSLAAFAITVIGAMLEWLNGNRRDWIWAFSGLFIIPIGIAIGVKGIIQTIRTIVSDGGLINFYRKNKNERTERKARELKRQAEETDYKRIEKAYESGEISRDQLPRLLNGIDCYEFDADMGLYEDHWKWPKDIVYVENEYCETLNDFFIRNRVFDFTQRYNIVYLPRLAKELEAVGLPHYMHPELPRVKVLGESLPSTYPIQYLSYPEDAPKIKHGLIIFTGILHHHGAEYIRGDYFPLEEGNDEYITEQLHTIIRHLHNRHGNITPKYMKPSKPDMEEGSTDAFADALFPWVVKNNEVAIIINEVREKIAKLRDMGIAEKVLEKLIKAEPKISRLVVTKDMRIILPDYHDMEIKMEPINKAVFLLFLKHPEGIVFKRLPDYRKELAEIYEHIKPLGLNERALKSIEDVTNPCLNSINEKCARIRGAFISQFDENLARQYYIYGERGDVKRIALPRTLVTWE